MNSLTASYDQGLRSYMIGVYNWMAIGLAVTFGIAWQMIATGAAAAIAHSGLFIVIALAPLALVFGIAFARNNAPLAAGLFLALTACIGVSMSAILIHYTLTSILTTFLATSASFAGLSLWGYTTKSDMSGLRTFFVAALFGLIALMVINIFIVSAGLHLLMVRRCQASKVPYPFTSTSSTSSSSCSSLVVTDPELNPQEKQKAGLGLTHSGFFCM